MRPQPGITPTRVWVSPNLACSLAIRKSQLSASSNPPVTATPLIAPISGLVRRGNGPRAPLRAGGFSDPPPEPELIPVELELAEVEPGAERRIGTGEHDHAHVVVGFGRSHQL